MFEIFILVLRKVEFFVLKILFEMFEIFLVVLWFILVVLSFILGVLKECFKDFVYVYIFFKNNRNVIVFIILVDENLYLVNINLMRDEEKFIFIVFRYVNLK